MKKVPLYVIKDLKDGMQRLAGLHDGDMKEYLAKGKDHLYQQAKAHKDTNEFWMHRLEDVIQQCEEGVFDDELEDSSRDQS